MNEITPQPDRPAPVKRSSPLWAKVLLVLAAVLMALGIVKGATTSEPAKPSPSASGLAMGFGADSSGDARSSGATASSSTTSQVPFRLGFSFAAAYAFAYAARMFFNFTIASAGFMIAALMGLQYAGLMEVKWVASGERFDHFHQWALSLVSSGETFVKGLLPSATASAAGLFAGWRRR